LRSPFAAPGLRPLLGGLQSNQQFQQDKTRSPRQRPGTRYQRADRRFLLRDEDSREPQ
jgi:hypothetical protein